MICPGELLTHRNLFDINQGAQAGNECIIGIFVPVSLLRRLSGGYFLSSPAKQHAYMGEREG